MKLTKRCFVILLLVSIPASLHGQATQQTPPETAAPPPFAASMLLVKSNWSQVPKAKEIEAELRSVLKDAAVPQTMLDQLPMSAPQILFSPQVVSCYTHERYLQLLAWLTQHELIKETIPFPPTNRVPHVKTTVLDEADTAGGTKKKEYHRTQIAKDSSFVPLPPLPQLNSPPFVEKKAEFRWSVQLQDTTNAFHMHTDLLLTEKPRGQSEPTAVEALNQTVAAFQLPPGYVAVLNALPAGNNQQIQQAARRGGFEAVVIVERATARPKGDVTAALLLPDAVEKLEAGGHQRMMFNYAEWTDRLRTSGNSAPSQSPFGRPAASATALKVFSLANVPAESLAATLRQLFGAEVSIVAEPTGNALLVRGTEPQLQEIEALVLRLDQRPAVDPNSPDPYAAASRTTAAEKEFDRAMRLPARQRSDLQKAYDGAEQQAARLADQLREQSARLGPQHPQTVQLKSQLRAAVGQAFAARQKLHQAELTEFQRRMKGIQNTLDARERIAPQIIDRRVEELLNPNLRWRQTADAAVDDTSAATDQSAVSPRPMASPASSLDSNLLRRASELERQFRGLTDEIREIERALPHNPPDLGNLQVRLENARRDLSSLKSEHATQVRLLELELQEAQVNSEAAALDLRANKAAFEAGQATAGRQIEAERAAKAAMLRVERMKTVLDCFQKAVQAAEPAASNKQEAKSSTATDPQGAGNTTGAVNNAASAPEPTSREYMDKLKGRGNPRGATSITLLKAVAAFNAKMAGGPIEKDQSPLTDEEVIASIRWAVRDRERVELPDRDFDSLRRVAEERVLPNGWSFEVVTNTGNFQVRFRIWSIRLTLLRPDGTRYEHLVRQRIICQLDTDAEPRNTNPTDSLFAKDSTPLAAAIHGFNQSHQTLDGQAQPPLTEEEVLAAIRFWNTKRNEAPVSNGEFAAFQKIADERLLPKGTEFEVIGSFEPGDGFEYKIWSVRIVMPRTEKPGWTYAYTIREQFVRSRRIDDGKISWGPAAPNGLQVGIQLDPHNAEYAIGQKVTAKFFYRNTGKAELDTSFPRLMTHSYYNGIHAANEAGQPIAIDQDNGPGGPVGWVNLPLAPAAQHSIQGLPIVFGDVPRAEGIETVVRAEPGQSVRLSFTLPNYADPNGPELRTGVSAFTLSAKSAVNRAVGAPQ